MERESKREYQEPKVEMIPFEEGEINCISTSVPVDTTHDPNEPIDIG